MLENEHCNAYIPERTPVMKGLNGASTDKNRPMHSANHAVESIYLGFRIN
jgi:hypothetical protein